MSGGLAYLVYFGTLALLIGLTLYLVYWYKVFSLACLSGGF